MKHFLKLSIVLISIAVLFSACNGSQPKSKLLTETITPDNLEELGAKLKEDSTFTSEDIEYFSLGLTRLTQNNDSLKGKTIGDVIDMQRKFMREQRGLQLQRTMTRVELALNHKFQFKGIRPLDQENAALNIIGFTLKNESDKDIANMQGVLQFYNPQQQLVKQFNLITKQIQQRVNGSSSNIGAGQEVVFNAPFDHNNDSRRDNIIRNNWQQLTMVWQPVMIEYADGSKVGEMVDLTPKQQEQVPN